MNLSFASLKPISDSNVKLSCLLEQGVGCVWVCRVEVCKGGMSDSDIEQSCLNRVWGVFGCVGV